MKHRGSHRLLKLGFFLLVSVALITACSSDKGTNGDDEEAPPPPPAAVADLAVIDYTPTSVRLSWTVPLDDEEHGTVMSYDIRYTTSEPGEGDWDSAIQVVGEPAALPGGMTQSMDIDSLTYGLTHYFAMKCLGEQGAVSAVSNLAEVELPVDFNVVIPDTGLEAALRAALGKPSGTLRYAELVTLTELNATNRGITDLSGLEYCENLGIFHAMDNAITDLSPLQELEHLWGLDLYANQIADVSPLTGVTTLEQLILGENEITDISPLATLTGLMVFRVHYNNIAEIGAVQQMTQLEWLDLAGNQIEDIGGLIDNTGLGDGDLVDLRFNPLSETAITTGIPALEARGVEVYY
jgi:hypothetical protein